MEKKEKNEKEGLVEGGGGGEREKLLLALKAVGGVKRYNRGNKPECLIWPCLGLKGLSPGAALPQLPPLFCPSFPSQRQSPSLSEPGQAPKETGPPLPTPTSNRL